MSDPDPNQTDESLDRSPESAGEENFFSPEDGSSLDDPETAGSSSEESPEASGEETGPSFPGKAKSVFSNVDSLAENAYKIGEILADDTSLDEKIGEIKDFFGKDSATGKMLGKIESLARTERVIVDILSFAGEEGLTIEQIAEILSSQENV